MSQKAGFYIEHVTMSLLLKSPDTRTNAKKTVVMKAKIAMNTKFQIMQLRK